MANIRVLLCGIGKLENNYIREWVEYHKNLGFTNIVLYDNNDKDGEHFEDVIGDYIESGYVILKDWRGVELAQIPSYNECYKEYKNSYDWIGYWDIDEFIEFEKAKNVQEFLKQKKFDGKQCIRVCWKQYTDNGLVKVVNNNYSVSRFKEVLDADFCKRNKIPVQRHIASNIQAKSFIRTTIKEVKFTSPHCFLHVPTVDADGNACEIGIQVGKKPIWKGAWLKHYRFKTIEEYVTKKMVRLWPTKYMNGGKDRLNLEYFFMFNKKTEEKENYANELITGEKKIKINSWCEIKNGIISHRNWGDEINYFFLPKILGAKFGPHRKKGEDNYSFIGSIANLYSDSKTVIWGSGIQVSRKLKTKPKKVCAVRGPITRKMLMEEGVECPEIYGDPSLLLPYFYYPNLEKKWKIGLIPHWSSLDSLEVKRLSESNRVHVIKMQGYNKWTDVIDEIVQCDYIISESLHGLIMAEAYNIPNLWVDITLNNIFDIKFHDFFQSIKMDRKKAIKVDNTFTIDKSLKLLQQYKKGEMVDLVKLVNACPFEITDKAFLSRVKNNIIVKTNKVKMNTGYEKGVSICITAYKAKKYIKETLDSVYSQTWFKKNDNWEVLVGIDNCQETFDYLKTIMHRYKNLRVFMMNSNMGTYVTTNTIMSIAKYDGLIRFDSDDIMLPNMVETIMTEKGNYDYITFKMQNFGRRSNIQSACGQIYIKHSVFDKFGGYVPWTCSADSELEMRLRKVTSRKHIDKVLFKRRIHTENLTVKKGTNFSSNTRRKNLQYVFKVSSKIKDPNKAVIKKVTNGYVEVFSDTKYDVLTDSAYTFYENEYVTPEETKTKAIKKRVFISKPIEMTKEQRIKKIYEAREKKQKFGNNNIHN